MTNDKDKRIKRLEEKVEKLENAVRMPTRREAIAAGGIGLAGLAGFSSGASAASPSDAVGPVYFDQIGDSDNPVSEFYVDKEYQAESDQNPVFDSVTTEQASINGPLDAESATVNILNSDWVVDAGDYETLQSAIDAAESQGVKTVIAPPATYTVNSTLEIPETLAVWGLGPVRSSGVEIQGDAGVDPVITTKNRGDGCALMRVLVSPDSSEEAFSGDLRQAEIKLCAFSGDVTITSNNSVSSAGLFSNNNMIANNITADSGVDSTFLIDGNRRVGTLTSNDATEGTNT